MVLLLGPEMVVVFDLCSLSGMLEVGFSDFNVSIALFFDGVVFNLWALFDNTLG